MMKNILIILLCIFLCSSISNAATHTAATCENKTGQTDVQDAVDSSSDGDTVSVPAGTCIWDTELLITGKAIILQGAGIGITTITDRTGSSDEPIFITGVDGESFTVTGFTFDGTNSSTWGLIHVTGESKTFKIQNNKFTNLSVRGITIDGYTYGVIDHNVFEAPSNLSVQAIIVFGDPDGDDAWNRDLTFGTANAVYIEDNTFTFTYKNDTTVDAARGGRYVVRYNTIDGANVGHHGLATGGANRSTFSGEIYNNTFTKTSSGSVSMLRHRGGTTVTHNNTWTGNFFDGIAVDNQRTCIDYAAHGVKCTGANPIDGNDETLMGDNGTVTGCSTCSTTVLNDTGASWTIDEWVGYHVWNNTEGGIGCLGLISENTATTITSAALGGSCSGDGTWANSETYKITNGYPCKDQVGRTKDQVLAPSYEWNNTFDAADTDFVIQETCAGEDILCADHIQENRDYYNDTEMPGYTAYVYPHPLATVSAGTTEFSNNLITEWADNQANQWTPVGGTVSQTIPAINTDQGSIQELGW